MISIGTPIAAAGAIKYFKSDLENQSSSPDDLMGSEIKLNAARKSDKVIFSLPDYDESAGAASCILDGVSTHWQGKLAEEFGLREKVTPKEFNRLCQGRHPFTREPLIRHVSSRTKTTRRGKEIQTKTHRAGLDQTISAPKSVTLVAMKDARVIKAHLNACAKAIKTAEEFTSAKMGNVKLPEETGKALYATFMHFETRPDNKNKQVAPGLHCHFFQINVTKTADGKYRSLEMRENYRSQKLVTAVYRSELHREMTALGYAMRIDSKTRAPEVVGISRDFIEANSPRQNEIIEKAQQLKIKSTKTVAANYRQKKKIDKTELIQRFEELEKSFGYQASRAAQAARAYSDKFQDKTEQLNNQDKIKLGAQEKSDKATEAVSFAIGEARKNKLLGKKERKYITRQSLLTEALEFASTETTISEVREEFSKREKKGDLNEFNLDRRRCLLTDKKAEAAKATNSPNRSVEQSEQYKEIIISKVADSQYNYEKSTGTQFATASPIRQTHANDSNSSSESTTHGAEQRDEFGSQFAKHSADHDDSLSLANSRTSFVERIGKGNSEKSDFEKPHSAIDCSPAGKSAEVFTKVGDTGKRMAAELQRNGGNDQTGRSRAETTSDDSADERNEAENKFARSGNKFRIGGKTNGDRKSDIANRFASIKSIYSRTRSLGSGGEAGKSPIGISGIRKLVEKYQRGSSQGFEDRKSFGAGNRDCKEQPPLRGINDVDGQKPETANSAGFGTGATRKGEARGNHQGASDRAAMGVDNKISETVNLHAGNNSADNVLLVSDDAGFDEKFSPGKTENGELREKIRTVDGGSQPNRTKLFRDNNDPPVDISERQPVLYAETKRPTDVHSETDAETNRIIAAKTAQIINLKFFAGQLDQRMVDEWTTAINKVSAGEFLSELLKDSSTEQQRQRTMGFLNSQATNFAKKLDLPKPELLTKPDIQLLAAKLTEVETKNYEAATGEKISQKTIEVLTEKNLVLAHTAPPGGQELEEFFKDLPAAPKFGSKLEAQTFIALLDSQAVGDNTELINQTQESVRRNETVSREAVTLVQIAYGGQMGVFNDDFKAKLADEIYYHHRSTTELYDCLAKSDWQKHIETFAPLVENIAKQNQLVINPPETDVQRNKFLADFVATQLLEAYKQQNNAVYPWMENRVNLELQKLGSLSVNNSQLETINKYSSATTLEPPKFSNVLEAESYKLLKRDDEETTTQAKRFITAVAEKVKEEASQRAAVEEENIRVMSM